MVNKRIFVKKNNRFLNLKHCFWERTNNIFSLLTGSQTRTYTKLTVVMCCQIFDLKYTASLERHGAFLSREREPDVALDELPPVEAGQSGARLLEGGGPSLPVVQHT